MYIKAASPFAFLFSVPVSPILTGAALPCDLPSSLLAFAKPVGT